MKSISHIIKTSLLLGGLGWALVSCRTVRVEEPVIVERIQHDTLHVTDTRRDSIYMQDSIYIHAVNDTIYSERWHTKYIERMVRYDSVVAVHDTIPVVKTVTKVEKEPYTPWYKEFFSGIGIIVCVMLGCFLLIKIKPWRFII